MISFWASGLFIISSGLHGHDASEPEHRLRSEVDPSNSSGCLHALADTASMHPWIVPVLPDPTVTLLDKASLGIVDEVGVSLPGGSVGPSCMFGDVQIHTGNL